MSKTNSDNIIEDVFGSKLLKTSETHPHIASILFDSEWVITERKMEEIEAFVSRLMAGSAPVVTKEEHTPIKGGDKIAVIPLVGTLVNRSMPLAESSGVTSYIKFAAMVLAASEDDSVSTIILDVDSPGGTVSGISIAADAVRAASARKPVIAVANSTMTSGAYWVASGATKIVASELSSIGSIGVIYVHEDKSSINEKEGIRKTIFISGEFKDLGSPDRPLTKDESTMIQDRLENVYGSFVSYVSKGRTIEESRVRELGARILLGKEAVEVGLVDSIDSIFNVISTITKSSARMNEEQMKALQSLVETLAQTVSNQNERISAIQAAIEEQGTRSKENEARVLVDSYIASGSLAPSMRERMISNAIANPELTRDLLSAIPPSSAFPLAQNQVFGTPNPNNGNKEERADLTQEEKEVYGQLNMIGPDGKVDPARAQAHFSINE